MIAFSVSDVVHQRPPLRDLAKLDDKYRGNQLWLYAQSPPLTLSLQFEVCSTLRFGKQARVGRI